MTFPSLSATSILALALAATVFAGGCKTMPVPVPLYVSAPQVIPAGVHGKIEPDGSTTLFLEGLDVEIEVRNQRAGRTGLEWGLIPVPFPPFLVPIPTSVTRPPESIDPSDGNPLSIVLKLLPRGEGFALRPEEVGVIPDGGSRLAMVAVTGPGDDSCAGVERDPEMASQEFALPSGSVTCFVLEFPIHISPDVGFRLNLSGMSTHGEPLPPVELRYLKFAGNKVD